MNIQKNIKQKKEIYNLLINYFDSDSDFEYYFQNLIDLINTQSKEDFQIFLHLILEISKNHHRDRYFNNKIERVIQYFGDRIKQTFSNSDIFKIFKTSKQILFFLFKNKIIESDRRITVNILQRSKKYKTFHKYFFQYIKFFYDQEWKDKIEKELLKYDPNIFENFDEKCNIGENDRYICSLIRNDSVEEFIAYVNRNNLPLSKAIIQPSIFETNNFLIKNKNIKLIEYAAFFGSIEIFQYLLLNNVELNSSLWLFGIHGRNAEMIHLLEENKVQPPNNSYEECLIESIKCHHNEIANYIQNNFINDQLNTCNQKVVEASFHFYNFEFFPDSINNEYCFEYSCRYNYIDLVKLFLNIKKPNSNENEIQNQFYFYKDIKFLHAAAEKNNVEIVDLLLSVLEIEISPYLFKQNKKLTEITIPQSVTKIGFYAFDGCESLKHISLPPSLTSIGYYAFYECKSLTKITIPDSVTEIDHHAFEKCSSLKKITIPSSITLIKDKTFANCTSLKEIKIPDSVTTFEKNCFYGCKSIQIFFIPNFVTTIGEGVFLGCSSITEITIPSTLTKIENRTFEECESLKIIRMHSKVNKIGDYAFNKCKSLEQISIPPLLKSIKKYVFNECSSLSKISIPSLVKEIKTYAFCGCSLIKEITIPSSVTAIGSFAFNKCQSLINISIPDSVGYIGEGAFMGCFSIIEISIPPLITTISDYVFEGCKSIKEIEIPSSVIKIGSYTFCGCISLEKVLIPSSVIKIGSYSFSGCSSLSQVSIPSSVTNIGLNAFSDCTSLCDISIPAQFISQLENIGIGSDVKICEAA